MKINNSCRLQLFVALFLCLFGGTSWGANRIAIPDDIQYHRFASSVYGPEAVWINPAALALYKNMATEYMSDYYQGKFLKNWGISGIGSRFGLSYRHLKDFRGKAYNELLIASGAEMSFGLYWGISYRYVKDGPDFYNKRHFWNASILVKNNPSYYLAIVFSNLNQGRVDGERSDFEELYSFSYRTMKGRLILSTEIMLSSGQSLSSASYNYGLEYLTAKQLLIYAKIDNSRFFQIGIKFQRTGYSFGGQSRYSSSGKHKGTTLFFQQEAVSPSKNAGRL
jgi:hypothetical protein